MRELVYILSSNNLLNYDLEDISSLTSLIQASHPRLNRSELMRFRIDHCHNRITARYYGVVTF